MISKVLYSNKKVNPFSGILFAIETIRKRKIRQIIDKAIGIRAKQAKYSYGDIILGWVFCNLCGAERLEDINKLNYYFKNVPDLKLPSPDSVGLVFRSFAKKTMELNISGWRHKTINHQFSIHMSLNNLLLKIIMKLKLLNTRTKYTLDYDNVILTHKKWDTRLTYKQTFGYQPGVSFIGRIPVYIEGRNGNTTAVHDMVGALERGFEILDNHLVQISVFRSDSAAYQGKVLKLMEDRGIKFYVRARLQKDTYTEFQWSKNWRRVHINLEEHEVQSSTIKVHGCDKEFRLVIYRRLILDELRYASIVTNDDEMAEEDVIHFYNKRGYIEQNFDILGNDFNWKRLPFSYLNENTVFMIISAMSCVIYHYLVRNYSKKVDFVKRCFRLKNWIYHFIIVASVWEDGALKLFTDRDYTPLIRDG